MDQNKKAASSWEGLAVVLLLSLSLIGMGTGSLCRGKLDFNIICMAFGGAVTAFGLLKIVMYLMRAAYRSITNYDFSIGLVLSSFGVCLIANSSKLGESFVQLMGILVLADAIIMIQYALQIHFMDGKLFPLAMCMAVSAYVFGLMCVVEPYRLFHRYQTLFYSLLCASGIFGLITMLMVWIRSRNLRKEEERDAKRLLEEAPETEAIASSEPELIPQSPDESTEESLNNEKNEELESINEKNEV